MRWAGDMFPLDMKLVTLPAYVTTANANIVSPQTVKFDLDRALKRDPWAWDLNFNKRELMKVLK